MNHVQIKQAYDECVCVCSMDILEIISLIQKMEQKDKQMENQRLLMLARRNVDITFNGYEKHEKPTHNNIT